MFLEKPPVHQLQRPFSLSRPLARQVAPLKMTGLGPVRSFQDPSRLGPHTRSDMRHFDTEMQSHWRSGDEKKIGVVHFGINILFRGLWAERLHHHLKATQAPWGIMALDQSAESVGFQCLEPQQGLYTRHIQDANSVVDLELIESVHEVGQLASKSDKAQALQSMAQPDFYAASLTLPLTAFELTDVQIAQEAKRIDAPDLLPETALGLIVKGQRARFIRDLPPFPVLVLDTNHPTGQTRQTLLSLAMEVDANLSVWLDASMEVPAIIVDRMCPDGVEHQINPVTLKTHSGRPLQDLGAVVTETVGMIVVEQSRHGFLKGLAHTGALLMTDHVDDFQQMKSTVVDGGQSIAAAMNACANAPANARINDLSKPAFIGILAKDIYETAGLNYDHFLHDPSSIKVQSNRPLAVLFNNDGTLVDSEYLARDAAQELVNVIIESKNAGPSLNKTEFAGHFSGMNFDQILSKLKHIRPGLDLTQDDIQYYTALEETNCQHLLEQRVTATPDTSQVLTMLRANHIDAQVVTSKTVERAEVALDKGGLREQVMPEIYSAVDTLQVPQPKPDAGIYEYAKIRATSKQSDIRLIAVEDSAAGVQSAVAAGIDVIAYVGGRHYAPEQRDQKVIEFEALGAKACFDQMALLPLVLLRVGLVDSVVQY